MGVAGAGGSSGSWPEEEVEPGRRSPGCGDDTADDDDDNLEPECGKRLEREREAATAPHS